MRQAGEESNRREKTNQTPKNEKVAFDEMKEKFKKIGEERKEQDVIQFLAQMDQIRKYSNIQDFVENCLFQVLELCQEHNMSASLA